MISHYVRTLIGGLLVNISSTLICYDSSAARPSETAECGKDMFTLPPQPAEIHHMWTHHDALLADQISDDVEVKDEVSGKRASLLKMCYSEYYAVNRSSTVRQYFDRFCVHQKHCADRGIDQICQTLEQLDKGIQKTFFKYHHAKPSKKTLIQSRRPREFLTNALCAAARKVIPNESIRRVQLNVLRDRCSYARVGITPGKTHFPHSLGLGLFIVHDYTLTNQLS
ncbi:hypothetical protein RB195_002319 [Necator americanus]|uniref:DUF7773 domain-containing protein n=1 Tax=Necator americanus TaxID=51031 RepID=A0ABR1DJW8_NECAM